MTRPAFHTVPCRPYRWLWPVVVSQVAVAGLWWSLGWVVGVLALVLSHAWLMWGLLWPRSALYSPVLARLPLPGTDHRVWLTIDDGPSPDTGPLLDLLDAHGAKATFFLVGERARARPEDVRAIVRRGHGIGNHSASHPQAWFWALGPRAMAREIEDCQAVLTRISGVAPHWFRAVVGMANPFVVAPLHRLGLARVAWSARGFDGVNTPPATAVARIEAKLAPGAIVLLHEGAPDGRHLDTVALLLQRLDAMGYRTVLPEHLPAPAGSQ